MSAHASDRSVARAVLPFAFLLVVIATYTWLWSDGPVFEGDSPGYVEVAQDVSDGWLDRAYMRAPGYPLFLILTGGLPEPGLRVVFAQVCLHVAAVALWLTLLPRLGASRLAIGAFLLVAVTPPFTEHARFVMSEALTEACLSTGLVCLAHWLLGGRAWWLVPGAIGLAVVGIVHPVYQLLWIGLPCVALGFRMLTSADLPALRRIGVAFLAFAVVAVPVVGGVMFHNQQRFGFTNVSPMLGATLSHKTLRVVRLLPDAYASEREVMLRYRDAALLDPNSQHLGYSYIFRAIPELSRVTGLSGPALDRHLVELNLALIRRAPMDYADEVLRSQVWYWGPGVTDVSGFGSPALKVAWNGLRAVVILGFFATLVLIAGPFVLFMAARRRHAAPVRECTLETLLVVCLCLAVVTYSCLLNTMLTSAVYRLRVPVDLPILLCVVLGPSLWWTLTERLRPAPEAAPLHAA